MRVRRDRWGVPHIEAASRSDLYFAQGFCHAQDRLWQMDFYRRVVSGRLSEMAGAEGLPVDRLMRTLGIRRVAEREAAALDPELRALLERFCEGVNAAAASARALPFEMQLLRLGASSPGARSTSSASASCSPSASPPTGSASCCAPTWCGALGPELTARLDPDLPGRQPDRHPGALVGRRPRDRRADRRRAPRDGPRRRGERLQQLGGQRRAQRHRHAADRRRPAPAPEHAGHLVPGRPAPTASASSAAPRCRGCRASTWARTTTSAGPSPTSCPTSRTSSSSGSRASATSSRTSGCPLEVVREEIAVKGRSEPDVLEVRITHHGPIVNEALGADEAEPLALRWLTLDEPTAFRGHVRAARHRLRPGAGRAASRATPRPPPT